MQNFEYVTDEELYKAYLDCRRHKRRTATAIQFEMNAALNLLKLKEDLNNLTYEIGKSIAFCVTRPKIREVFAASFRDRIVHHLLINRLETIFENSFIEDTYNCRKRKGTLYGVRRLHMKIRTMTNGYTRLDIWILSCDLLGFFMSIDKSILWGKLEELVKEHYKESDIDWILWLTKKIVDHRPEKNCSIHGSREIWKKLPRTKSLFYSNGNGMAIGNLTSQIFANYYLTEFDHWISNHKGIEYGRYVDDFYLVGTRARLKSLLPKIRKYLKEELKLTLHPDKIRLLHYSKGIKFVGMVVHYNRLYVGTRTIYNALKVAKSEKNPIRIEKRINSYMGHLYHANSYRLRKKLWNSITYKEGLVCTNLLRVNIIKRLRERTKTLELLKLERNANTKLCNLEG